MKSCCIIIFFSFFFLLSSVLVEESVGLVQIFDLRFSMDLHVLGCPEQCFNLFINGCLSVWSTNFVAAQSENGWTEFHEILY